MWVSECSRCFFWVETLGKLFHCYLSPADTFLLIFMHCSLCAKSKELLLAGWVGGSIMRLRHHWLLFSSCIQNFEHFKPDYLIVGELSARRNPTNFKWRNNRGERREYLLSQSQLRGSGLLSVFAQGEEASNVGVQLNFKIESPRHHLCLEIIICSTEGDLVAAMKASFH